MENKIRTKDLYDHPAYKAGDVERLANVINNGLMYEDYLKLPGGDSLEKANNFLKTNPKTKAMDLTTARTGDTFVAGIENVLVEGKISVEHGNVYLCQNVKDGGPPRDRLGYSYGWNVGDGSESCLKRNCVVLLEHTPCPIPCKQDLTDVPVGSYFKGTIRGLMAEGRIQKEGKYFYLCQDVKNGSNASNKLGYKYSWIVHEGKPENLKSNDVVLLEVRPDPAFKVDVSIKIGGNTVEFRGKDGIQVGCQYISAEKVFAIASKLAKMMSE